MKVPLKLPDILFILDVYARAAYITSCATNSSRDMSELLQTVSKEAQLGQRNFWQQLSHINNKYIFHFLLPFSFLLSFQTSFQTRPDCFARELGFTAIAVLLVLFHITRMKSRLTVTT
jgi:hypothetical protein